MPTTPAEPKHTPTPWCQGGPLRPHYVYSSEPHGSFAVASFASPSNAARAVDCVNACEGINDPAAALAELREAYTEYDRMDGAPAAHNRLMRAMYTLTGRSVL